jgi:hypothetical protein
MAKRELDAGNSDGTSLGQSATSKVGFFGVTPAVQPTSANQAAVATSTITTAATSTTPYGYATTTQADAVTAQIVLLRTLVNQMRSDLVTVGIIKGS